MVFGVLERFFIPLFSSPIDIKQPFVYHSIMKTAEINEIEEMLQKLPKKRIQEVRAFIGYIIDREQRRKALIDRVLKAEQNPDTVTCSSAEEFLLAIESAEDDDDQT
ncbi:MAG: hypothetical protein A2Y97_01885 [Nitrospirae bacterium RBG_13_39_12]|nr:MAG: hypothetical protein A2Y97_01885 [Nitrospirae bacterium RBG_13_39_12]